jgi:hypothetical protein
MMIRGVYGGVVHSLRSRSFLILGLGFLVFGPCLAGHMTVAWFEPCRLLPLFLSAASSTPPPIVSPDPTFSGDAKPGDLDKPTVPSSPSTTTVSLSSQPETIFMDDRERHVEHRVLEYAAAVTDFFGTGIVCIFKTGSPWPARDLRKSPSNFQRETRAVHGHPIGPSWSAIAAVIKDVLDIKETNPTSISPLACANVGDRYSFCPLFIRIGVARTVTYDAAVQAASAIHDVLTEYGFSDVNVALVESHESLNVDSPSSVNEALPLNPAPSDIRQLKKPFTSVPGRPISLLDHPSFEGTGSVCLRLGEGRIGVLTCAHVAGPPPVNRTGAGFTHVEGTGQPPLMVISPGTVSLKLALKAINDAVNDHTQKIDKATNDLTVYGYNPDNPDPAIESLPSVSYILSGQHTAEQARIELQELLNELTAHGYTENASARARMIGFVRHCEQIRCSGVVPDQYTDDWAIVEYFTNVVNQASFIANKIFIGTSDPLLRCSASGTLD